MVHFQNRLALKRIASEFLKKFSLVLRNFSEKSSATCLHPYLQEVNL